MNNIVEQAPPRVPLLDDLPPPNTRRWVVHRKAAVIAAVRAGKITMEEALRCYQLAEEELLSWQRAFESHGLPGLRVSPRLRRKRLPPRCPASTQLAPTTVTLAAEQQAVNAEAGVLHPCAREAGFFGARDGRALINFRVLYQLIKA